MSKKKVSGNTMTLKDFHGGSIPTDLPLPSAPGVVIRPSDRSTFDRSNSWVNPTGRSDHRSRPHTSPATRHLDDKAPFLSDTAHIGRNFDEDERKPLDGVSAPRRTISDESIRVNPARAELKQESSPTGAGLRGRQGWAPTPQPPSGTVNSYSGKVNEVTRGGLNSPNLDSNVGQGGASGAHPNAWAAKKEAAVGVAEQVQSAWPAPSAASKLAHASALEKVSSGRWQSKHSSHFQADVEVMRSSEVESGSHSKSVSNSSHNRVDVTGGDYYDANLAGHAERGLTIDGSVQGVRKELPDYERARAPLNSDVKERNITSYNDRRQPDHVDGKFSGPEHQSSTLSDSTMRPKLRLLPRTKPVEGLESPVADHTQAYQQATESGRAENFNDSYRNISPATPGTTGAESEKLAVERPKLNLKPRSQPLEHLEGNVERDRNALFGGARPRELVLKERGADDPHDSVQHSEKVEHHVPRMERVPAHANASRYSERTENYHVDQRIGKKVERRDNRADVDRVDMQKRNWRNENRRIHRDTERQLQQPDRPPSPETWRKPIEMPKPSSTDGAGLRHGKAASAVELAQAFSRSVSDPNTDRFSGQKGIPGRGQLPFSRLMGTSRPQINGY
ncbi:uncharacterized protein LOC107421413 [Ziziphus jujuba]|uniref:Uncharacterized protein LOC107421413 n=2 Tax=Ziziphus jujuba TaxID=326968 RepID=A0A6P6G9G6_ZIZJJ|nr:uncharacterized protein LOC107421413 [Ziziphus jujuba]